MQKVYRVCGLLEWYYFGQFISKLEPMLWVSLLAKSAQFFGHGIVASLYRVHRNEGCSLNSVYHSW